MVLKSRPGWTDADIISAFIEDSERFADVDSTFAGEERRVKPPSPSVDDIDPFVWGEAYFDAIFGVKRRVK